MGRKTTKEMLLAINDVASGSTYSEAASRHGLTWNGVKKACIRRGINQSPQAEIRAQKHAVNNTRFRGPDNALRNKEIMRLVGDGLTYGQAAQKLGISRFVVAGVVHRAKQGRAA